ncbi:hypothetical protein [Candidatus Vampirococcus lugosii]|uniref:Phospho-N-acetylmuramoyl-pentapeptide-transferase n=1 Tax=Candidatus Vampirococcus lugosii TaxID=2789015 RepID=A0ABS5QPG0_9BACT|nr:hypothetical protein [Candidatus Vampirococcus lugosii]MBS8122517.1 phospho-N-acetylmuramoyl-pentapeptide-transferase [Candidatus Vampirococcus lugosii]
MLLKLDSILLYLMFAFFISLILYPFYIYLLSYIKAGKNLREDGTGGGKAIIFNKLHSHKIGTPTMGGGLVLFIVLLLVLFSYILQYLDFINFSLVTRQETYIILFAFFSMGILGLIDDYLNIKGIGKIKGLTAKMKLVWMFLFSAFISYWFYIRLGITSINLWPFTGSVDIGFFYSIFTFIFTIAVVNAINITDGLDGLVGGLCIMILAVLGIITFFYGWYLATTVIAIVLGSLLAFLWFNINPAKIFMGDSGALALGGLISSLIYLLDIRVGIIIPFMFLFLIFWVELSTSFLQIFWKKIFKKKLFAIAPFHHLLEYKGNAEYTIVMKLWLIQGVLSLIALVMIFYQFNF